MDSLLYSLHATVPIFAVIFISWALRRRGFLPDAFLAGADRFVFRVLLPLLLFRDIAAGRITEQFNLRFVLFCLIGTSVMFFAVWGLAEIFLRDKSLIGAFTQASFRGSLAVMGIAFVQNMYGNAGPVPLMIVASVPLFNIYSVIVLVVRGPHEASGHGAVRMCLRGILTNPIILGIFAGLPFSLLSIDIPPMAAKTLDYFASMATPLALVLIGAGFEGHKALSRLRPTLWAAFLKLLALPALSLLAAYALGLREQALVSILILFGAPSTVTCYIMAKNMGGDAALSSSIIVTTTALSAFTLTFFLYVLRATGAI